MHHKPPRIRKDMTTTQRRAHSRTSQKPAVTFDRRALTHEHVIGVESGAVFARRRLSEHELSVPGVAEAAAAVDAKPSLGPEFVDEAYLRGRSETVLWRGVRVARGVVLERERRAARDRQRGRDVAEARALAARRREQRERSVARARRPHVSLDEAKRRAAAERAAKRRAEREVVEAAAERAVVRVRVRRRE